MASYFAIVSQSYRSIFPKSPSNTTHMSQIQAQTAAENLLTYHHNTIKPHTPKTPEQWGNEKKRVCQSQLKERRGAYR